MYRKIFTRVKNIIPKISSTELIALQSGTTSVDRMIFNGYVNLKNFRLDKTKTFPIEKIDNLLNKYGNDTVYPSEKTNEIFSYLGKNKFFS